MVFPFIIRSQYHDPPAERAVACNTETIRSRSARMQVVLQYAEIALPSQGSSNLQRCTGNDLERIVTSGICAS